MGFEIIIIFIVVFVPVRPVVVLSSNRPVSGAVHLSILSAFFLLRNPANNRNT